MDLATPTQLQEKILLMLKRERELETALREARSHISRDSHPLLVQESGQDLKETPNLCGMRSVPPGNGNIPPSETPYAAEIDSASPEETQSADELSTAFGTLSMTTERGLKVSMNIISQLQH